MPEKYRPLPQMHGNLLCSVDVETSGTDIDVHEVIQLAIVPLDHEYNPLKTIKPFRTYIRNEGPLDPEATKVHGIDSVVLACAASKDRVIDRLMSWVNDIGLVFDRRLIMLAHNSPFENKWLNKTFGGVLYEKIFNANTRDSMALAIGLNDMAVAMGRVQPFEKVSMKWLTAHFGIVNPKEHDAYFDAVATAAVYRELLKTRILL